MIAWIGSLLQRLLREVGFGCRLCAAALLRNLDPGHLGDAAPVPPFALHGPGPSSTPLCFGGRGYQVRSGRGHRHRRLGLGTTSSDSPTRRRFPLSLSLCVLTFWHIPKNGGWSQPKPAPETVRAGRGHRMMRIRPPKSSLTPSSRSAAKRPGHEHKVRTIVQPGRRRSFRLPRVVRGWGPAGAQPPG